MNLLLHPAYFPNYRSIFCGDGQKRCFVAEVMDKLSKTDLSQVGVNLHGHGAAPCLISHKHVGNNKGKNNAI